MNISYYTIDDLRLPAKRLLRKGWTMERFPTLEEALARYRVLPASGIKALGLTDVYKRQRMERPNWNSRAISSIPPRQDTSVATDRSSAMNARSLSRSLA